MASCIISFSGRKDGNCAAIARTLLGALAGEARCFGFSALRVPPCGGCGYECFQAREACPYFSDPAFSIYEAITDSDLSYFIVPNYCDYPCANFFEPVFTAEDAGGTRDFSARQGAFSQEYFVYCKKTQRSMAEKDPSTRRLRL